MFWLSNKTFDLLRCNFVSTNLISFLYVLLSQICGLSSAGCNAYLNNFRTRLSTYGKFKFPLRKINYFILNSLLQQRIKNDLFMAWQKIFLRQLKNYLFEAVWFSILKRSTQLVTMNRTVNRCKLDRRLKANGKLYTNFVRAARLPQYGNFIFCRRDENDIMKTEGWKHGENHCYIHAHTHWTRCIPIQIKWK